MYLFFVALVKPTKLSQFILVLLSIGCLTLVSAQTRQSNADGQKVTKEELDTRLSNTNRYSLRACSYFFS